jgi:hypothetical protein
MGRSTTIRPPVPCVSCCGRGHRDCHPQFHAGRVHEEDAGIISLFLAWAAGALSMSCPRGWSQLHLSSSHEPPHLTSSWCHRGRTTTSEQTSSCPVKQLHWLHKFDHVHPRLHTKIQYMHIDSKFETCRDRRPARSSTNTRSSCCIV